MTANQTNFCRRFGTLLVFFFLLPPYSLLLTPYSTSQVGGEGGREGGLLLQYLIIQHMTPNDKINNTRTILAESKVNGGESLQ